MSLITVCACLFSSSTLFAQSQPQTKISVTNKESLYFTFGWHRVHYTNSTIHFRDGKNYDFRLIKAGAIDDNDIYIANSVETPQYSARIGYFFKPDIGIEINFDHTKYILKQGQRVRLRGSIDGVHYDKDTMLTPSFISYEHTDGANYWMINFVKRKQLVKSKNGKHELSLVIKPGAGLVTPRTESTIMGKHRNDRYHVSGYVAGVETGLRQSFFKNFLAELTIKGVYANYSDVLLYGSGRANQQWWSFQYLFLIGYQLNVGNKK